MKNHQVAQLINAIRDRLYQIDRFKGYQPLREVIAHVVLDYLLEQGLLLDAEKKS